MFKEVSQRHFQQLLFSAAILLSGCAELGYQRPPVEDAGTSPAPTRPTAKPAPQPAKPSGINHAVYALMNKAHNQYVWQQYDKAAVTLERAIRIEPRNPELYYRLALVRSKQQHPAQAQQLCRKAIAVSEQKAMYQEKCRGLL